MPNDTPRGGDNITWRRTADRTHIVGQGRETVIFLYGSLSHFKSDATLPPFFGIIRPSRHLSREFSNETAPLLSPLISPA
ncbi:hypothetical protein TNCT_658291, partial [Trichonephila clavata]